MRTALACLAVFLITMGLIQGLEAVPDCPDGADPLLIAAWTPAEALSPRGRWLCVRSIQ